MHKSSPRETSPRSRPISQDRVGEGTPPRRAKSSNQRLPRKAPITGHRRRPADESGAYCRRAFNFWALRGAHGKYGRAGRKYKRRSDGMRPPGRGAATRALRREVPKSCNHVRPRWWSQRFPRSARARACGATARGTPPHASPRYAGTRTWEAN